MSARKFLLVDDDPGVTFLNRYLLENSGTECLIDVAENGQEALAHIEKNGCPDIIVLDVNMPVMDGFDFLQEFKKKGVCAGTQVFVLTSSLRDTDRETALSFECVKAYLEKPLNDELVTLLLS
jgi:CheY-like chemotaxis protein